MDRFFTQLTCDRCGGSLEKGRTMSMYSTECICIECKEQERKKEDYLQALYADQEQIRLGNYSFKGIGFKKDEKDSN